MFWEKIRDAFRRTIIVHLVYVIIILGISFYLLLSVRFAEVESLRDILNFALGFASLFLALVAIFQTLASGTDIHRVLGSAVASTAEVKRASSEFTEKVVPHADRIARAADEVSEQSKMLQIQSEQIDNLLADFRSLLESKFTEQRSLIETIGMKIETPKALGVDSSAQELASMKSVGGPAPFSAYQMSKRTTVGGHGAIYAAIRSFQKKTPVVLKDIFENEQWRTYISGLLNAFETLGAIDVERTGNDITVRSLNLCEIEEFLDELVRLIIKSDQRQEAGDAKNTDASFISMIRLFYNYFGDAFPLDQHDANEEK